MKTTPNSRTPFQASVGLGSYIAFCLIICTVIAFNIYWFSIAGKVHVTRADDSIIAFFPAGLDLVGRPLKEFFIGLMSSFRFEDHFYPMGILWGYFLQFFFRDAVASAEVPARILYFVNFASITGLSYLLWRSKLKTLLTFVLFGLNFQVNQRMILGNYHPLTLPLALLTLYCLLKVLEDFKPYRLVLFGFSFFLLSLPLESGFAIFPVFGILALGDILGFGPWNQQSISPKIKKLIILLGTVVVAFLPYLIGHYFVYSSFIPKSSNPMQVTYDAIEVNVRDLLSVVFYGVAGIKVRVVLIGLVVSLLVPMIRKNVFTLRGAFLFIGLLLQCLVIALTNRIEGGLWVFTGVLICFVLTDVLGNLINAALKSTVARKFSAQVTGAYVLFLCVCGLAWFQASQLDALYFRWSKDFTLGELFHGWNAFYEAFYRVVDDPTSEFTIIELPGSRYLGQVEVYWLGNKLYHHESGLSLYPEAYVFFTRGMFATAFKKSKERPYSFYEKYLHASPGDNRFVTLKDEWLFHRVFLNSDQNTLIRAEVTEVSETDDYKVYLPQVGEKNLSKLPLQATFRFDEDPSKIIQAVTYNGKKIEKISFNGNDLILSSVDWKSNGVVYFEYPKRKKGDLSKRPELKNFDIKLEKPLKDYLPPSDFVLKNDIPSILLSAEESACAVRLGTEIFQFWGTLEANQQRVFQPIIPLREDDRELVQITNRPIVKNRKIDWEHKNYPYRELKKIIFPCKRG